MKRFLILDVLSKLMFVWNTYYNLFWLLSILHLHIMIIKKFQLTFNRNINIYDITNSNKHFPNNK